MTEYAINFSPIHLQRNDYDFYFSSEKKMNRFIKMEDKMIEEVSKSLSNRFGVPINAENIARVSLYFNIQKGCSKCLYKGDEFTWLNA